MSEDAQSQPRKPVSDLPVRKLISPKLWKHLLLGCLGVGLAAAILWGGYVASSVEHAYGPGFTSFFDLSTARAVSYYNAAMLTLAGQLCLLIWWVRSQSWKDFAGRYRVWFWSAAACFGSAFVALTDAHLAWSQTVLWFSDVQVWNKEVLSWLVPIGAPAAVFYLLLQRDTRDCRVSVSLLRLSGLAMLGAALWALDFRPPEHEVLAQYPVPDELVAAGLPMLGCFSLMFGLLLHARYVIFESAEPPRARASRWKSIFRKESKSNGATDGSTADAEAKSSKRKTRAKKKTASKKSSKKSSAAKSSNANDDLEVSANEQQPATATEPDRQHWIDGPINPAKLKGLSKRERRRVRKQWRDEQRTEAIDS